MTRVTGLIGKVFLVVVLLFATDVSSKTIDGFSIEAKEDTIQMDKRSHHGLSRIVGGQVVKYGEESTWTVSLRDRYGSGGIFCAGALVTNSHVVTAAQCVVLMTPDELLVGVGDWSRRPDAGEIISEVKNIAIHPNYYADGAPSHGDVAVLELVEPVEWDEYKRPVALPTSDVEWTHQETLFTVSGWGSRTEDGRGTFKLHQADVPFVDFNICGSRYGDDVKRGMLCAGDLEKGGVDACIGDAGGPLVTFEPVGFYLRNSTDITKTLIGTEKDEIKLQNSRNTPPHPKINYLSQEDFISEGGLPILAGVVSWGQGCARAEYPGVYADMRTYREWVYSQTGGAPIWIITP